MALIAALSPLTGAAVDMSAYGAASVAPFAKPPVIDGTLTPGEWDGAVGITGFQSLGAPGYLEARLGQTWIGFTADAVYIAIVSEFPPDGKDHAACINRDSDVIFDECVEVWLDPNRANRAANTGDLTFYQFIGNARGTIYDVAFHPKNGPNTGWNGNWEFKNRVDAEKHTWTAELRLPFADLGWKPGEVMGKELGVLLARNYKAPWSQATMFTTCGAFVDWYRYAAIRLTPDAPSVQITSLGENLFKAELQLKATLFNPGAARQVKISALTTSSDMPERRDEKLLDLPAGGRVPYTFDVVNLYHETAQHKLSLNVTSADGKDTYLRYAMPWTQAPKNKWQYRIGPDPDAAVRMAYYPSYQFVRVQVDTRELGKDAETAVKKGTVRITGASGAKVLEEPIELGVPPFLKEFKVGDLKDGEYAVAVTLDGWKDPFVRNFTRKHFPFEGNKLGITDQVLAPFTPLAVKGQTIAIIGREYVVGGLGLPASVTSLGHELLAAPMSLVADGKDVLKGAGKFTKTDAQTAVFEGEAKYATATVTTRCTTEIDGCIKIELTLAPPALNPEPRTLNSLYLDIPLKDAEMPLWHITSTTLRVNPAGNTPPGDGLIWDSTRFADGNWFGNFKCYLWLGDVERGLCWFADNDRGWALGLDAKGQPNVACQQLFRKNGVLTLRINLVQQPVVIKEPSTIVFGIMASPGKPMPKDWRLVDYKNLSAFNMCYTAPTTFSSKQPWGNDWSIADWSYQKRIGKPGPAPAEIEAWKTRNFAADMDPKFRESMINLALGPFLNNFSPAQKYFTMYFDEFHTTAQAHAETHVFQSEWSGNWYGPLLDHPTKPEHKEWGIGVAGIVPSHRDFACYYAAEWVKRGIGCYFDNSFPTRAYDLLTTNAYRLPNGQVQPSAGIWARREYLRRIWNIHRTLAPPDAVPVIMIHMTNSLILPYMVWGDQNLDLEWKFGPEIQQTKFTPDFLRAESCARQTGSVPFVLDRILDAKSKEEQAIAERTKFGVMAVHECRWWGREHYPDLVKLMLDFGYGQDDCTVWNYWQPECPVTVSDADCKLLVLKRGTEAFLLACTWNPKPATVTVTFAKDTLGLTPAAAEDAETKEALGVANGALTLPMPGYGVRLVRVR